ncbi:MAG: transposase [Candidatus Heimdallarchaeota archaeon]|nr:transposase [Candidatus Heimdallarchaeota archaeon]
MKLLLSVPGIGPDTAAILLAEIVDISYFAASNKLA